MNGICNVDTYQAKVLLRDKDIASQVIDSPSYSLRLCKIEIRQRIWNECVVMQVHLCTLKVYVHNMQVSAKERAIPGWR
jgi:hypothetical protein